LQQKKPINIPINKGSLPDWQTRLGYPNLFNMFVGDSGYLYSTPGLVSLSETAEDENTRAIHYTKFGGGRTIYVTKNKVFYIKNDGGYVEVATISNSGLAVQIDENIANQIGITDGKNMYVFNQPSSDAFVTLGAGNGFNITTPISLAVINNITVVLDRKTNTWIISTANNMLNYPTWNFPLVDNRSSQGISLEVLNNNLYIFGTTGAERWVPTTTNNTYVFPLAKDVSYWVPYGARGTNAVCSGKNEIFLFSTQYTPMVINSSGYANLKEPISGLSKIVSQYDDVDDVVCSYSTFRGNSWLYMTWQETGISWVYNRDSKTFHQVDDLVIDSIEDREVVGTPNGVFNYSLTPDHKHRSWTSEIIKLDKGIQPNRQVMNAFKLDIIQGLIQPTPADRMELTLSLDGQSWTNTVWRPWGKTGHRNDVMTWSMNLAAQECMYRVDYYGSLDLTISKAQAYIS
jgi:hypothetical protein